MASTPQSAELTTDTFAAFEEDLSIFDHCANFYFIFGSILGGTLILLGLLGNGLTLILMHHERKKSSTINCLFMLAIADSLVLVCQGFYMIPVGVRKFFWGWWSGHDYNQTTTRFLYNFMFIFNQVSAFLTMLVSFHRYVSVCDPTRAKQL
jgi:hypothetical protein